MMDSRQCAGAVGGIRRDASVGRAHQAAGQGVRQWPEAAVWGGALPAGLRTRRRDGVGPRGQAVTSDMIKR